MARTKKAKREWRKELPGNRAARGSHRMVWVNSSKRGWRPRRRQIVATGLAKICDDERLQQREKILDVVEVRGSELPDWGAHVGRAFTRIPALALALVASGITWAVVRASADASTALACPQVLRGMCMVGIPLAVAIFASTCLGDLRILQPKTRTETAYERTAQWLPGELTEERDERRSKPCSVSAEQCIPGHVPGRVISTQTVEPGYVSFSNASDKDVLVTIFEATADEIARMNGGESRIDVATERPVAMTLEDRHGAIMPALVEKYGSRSAVIAKEQDADIERKEAELDPHVSHEPHSFELDVRRLSRALPKTITNTGTGMYWVKKTPTLHNDTQSGAIVGQTVNFNIGGLGVNAFIGGYISNTSQTEIRAIVSNGAGSAVLEGNLTNWQANDTLEVYDAWGTWALSNAQLFTDQGTAEFTSLQYVRGFAGTYTETLDPSSSLNPSETNGYYLIAEGDPNASRDDIHIDAPSLSAVRITFDGAWVRHLKAEGHSTSDTVSCTSGAFFFYLSDCTVIAISVSDAVDSASDTFIVEDCTITTNNDGIKGGTATTATVRRCVITSTSGTSNGIQFGQTGNVEGTLIDGFAIGLLSVTNQSNEILRNNTFYDCAVGFELNNGIGINTHDVINCIFSECPTVIKFNAWLDESVEGKIAGPLQLWNNCFHNYTTFATDGAAATRTYAQIVAMDLISATGNLDATDPLFTSPGSDFSLQVGSPCRNAGHGAAVSAGFNDVAFGDPPDIGGWSSGVIASNPPTWTANTSNIIATDKATSGEVTLSWDAATPGTGDVGYIIESQTAAGPGAWGEDARTTTHGTVGDPFIVGGLANGVERNFRVKAYSRIAGEPTTTPVDTDSATPTAAGIPDAPAITATDLLNQSDVRVDVVAGDPADVSTIYYQIRPDGVLQTWGNTVTGDGSETLTGLLVKPYVIYAVATRGSCGSDPSNLVFLTVQAADQYTNIRTALYEWVKGVVGNPTVDWRESNAPQPGRQYVTIKMDPTTPIGHDYHTGADANGVETVVGDREFIFSVQVHGKPSDEDGSASISILERIRSSLEKRSVQAEWAAAGIAFVREEGFGDLAGIGGTAFEARVFMDIRIRTQYSDDDDVGFIATAVPAGTLE